MQFTESQMREVFYRCPKCGTMLIEKEGRYGKFLACPRYPDCRYTRALWAVPLSPNELPPICSRCNGTGLLPFKREDGSISPYCKVFCDCHPVYGENAYNDFYSPSKVGDMDFPVSDTFRGYFFEYCGVPDPGYIPPERQEEAPKPQEIIHRYSDMGIAEFDLLQQTANQVKYLQGKVDELPSKKRKYIKYK